MILKLLDFQQLFKIEMAFIFTYPIDFITCTGLQGLPKVPPFKFINGLTSLNKSSPSYDSRFKKRFTLSCEIFITSPNRRQLTAWGSLNKKPTYIDKLQRAVLGRVIFLITAIFNQWRFLSIIQNFHQCVTSITLIFPTPKNAIWQNSILLSK